MDGSEAASDAGLAGAARAAGGGTVALTRVELEQFTAFATLKLDLCRGINILIGANGTGKTHLMKVCYAACDVSRSPADDFAQKLVRVFMPSGRALRRLVRQQGGADGEAAIRVWRGALKLEASFSSRPRPVSLNPSTFTPDDPDRQMEEWASEPVECVYVPVKEMLSNGPGSGHCTRSAKCTSRKCTTISWIGRISRPCADRWTARASN